MGVKPSDTRGNDPLAGRTLSEGAVKHLEIFKPHSAGTNRWDADRRCAGFRIELGGTNMQQASI